MLCGTHVQVTAAGVDRNRMRLPATRTTLGGQTGGAGSGLANQHSAYGSSPYRSMS
ncbi:hypothetical protein LY12_005009 [Prauserella alba]|nr:hypothetical protein [Prauserella alba]